MLRCSTVVQREIDDARSTQRREKPVTKTVAAETALPDEHLEDEEKILAGRVDVNMPALLTKDVHGGWLRASVTDRDRAPSAHGNAATKCQAVT